MATDVKISIALDGADKVASDARKVDVALQAMGNSAHRMIDAMAASATKDIADQARQMAEAFSQVGNSSEGLKQAGEALNQLGNQSIHANRSMTSWRGAVADFSHMGQSILIAKEAISGFANAASAAFLALNTSQQAAQKLAASLEFSSGSARGAASEIAYLSETSRKLGLDFASASTAYAKFAAASREAGLQSETVKSVFEGISKASARLGLSAEETQGALLALSQMASKGTVQAEELRGQLGERLPGAFSIAAKAMGVTESQLSKLLETGKVVAGDFLPKFGAALNEKFAAPLTSLTAEMNRFSSAWELWKREFADSDGGGFKWMTNGLNEATKAMASLGKEAGVTKKILASIAGFQMGAFGWWGGAKFDTVLAQQKALEKYGAVSGQVRSMESKSYLNPMEQEELRALKRQKDALHQELDDLAERRGKETWKPLDLKGDAERQMEANRAAIKQIYDNAAKYAAEHGDQAAKKRLAFEDFDKQFGGLKDSNPAYYAQLRKQLDESFAGPSKNDLQQALAARLSMLQEASRQEIEIIKERVKAGQLTEFEGLQATNAAQADALQKQLAVQQEMVEDAKDKGDKAKAFASVQKTLIDQAANELKARLDLAAASKKASADYFSAVDKENTALDASILKAKEELAAIGQTAEAKDRLRAKSLELAAQQAEETAAVYETARAWAAANKDTTGADFYERAQAASADRAKKLRELANVELQQAGRREVVKAAEDSKRAWEEFARDIERSLTDGLMRGFEAGKGYGRNFVDSVRNTLKTASLKLVVQAIVNPIMGGVGQLLGFINPQGGAAFDGARGGGGAGFASTAFNGISLYNAGTSLYGAGQAAYAGYGLTAAQAQAAASAYYSAGYYGTGAAIQAGSAVGAGGAAGAASGTTAGASASSAAAAAMGSPAVMAAAVAAAYILNKKLSNGYSISNSAEVKNVMQWTGAFGGVINRAFGMRGRTIDAQGIEGEFTGNGFSGRTFEDWSQKGGWFRSNRHGTNYGALSADQQDAFRTAASNMASPFLALQAAGGGESLSDRVDAFRYSVRRQITGEADIAALIRDVSDAMGKSLLPQLEKFQGKNEALADTAKRLTDVFAATNAAAAVLGQDMQTAFGALGIASAEARLALVDLAGGVDVFRAQLQSYYNNYYTQDEQLGRLKENLSEQFTAVGRALPASKEAFRALAESLDKTTYAGQKTFSVLMAAQQNFSDFIDGISSKISDLESQRLAIAQNVIGARDGFIKSILSALGRTGAVRAMDLRVMDPLNRPLARFSYALQDAQSAVQKLSAAQAVAAQAQIEYSTRLTTAGSGIAEFVRSLREGMAANGTSLAQTFGSYQTDLSAARAGDVSASERIPNSAKAYLDAVRQTAGTSTEVDIAMTRVAAELEGLPAVKSWAEVQAKSLETINDTLEKTRADLVAKTEALNQSLVAVLNEGFSVFDTSLDGLLSFDELKAGLSGIASDDQIRDLIKAVDQNGDGQISKMEAVRQATTAVDDNTGELIDGSDSQIVEMRRMVAETVVNSGRMMELNASILALKNEIVAQNAEKKREADISAAQLALESFVKQQEGTVQAVQAGIQSIWDLAGRYGVSLLNGAGGGAQFDVSNGLFNADYQSIGYTVGRENDVTAFRNSFYSAGGAYDKTYGMADDLQALADKIAAARQAVRDLGAVPKFAIGTNFVPNDMLAGIHKGERIIPAADNRELMARLRDPAGNADLVEENRELRRELALLRAEMRAVAIHTQRGTKRLDELVGDGIIVRTEAGAPLEVV